MAEDVGSILPISEASHEDVYDFAYADGLTFPSVLTPFHWSSLLPMLVGALLLTIWIVHKTTQFYFVEECFKILCTSDSAAQIKTKKTKNLPSVPVTILQPVLMPPKDTVITIKL